MRTARAVIIGSVAITLLAGAGRYLAASGSVGSAVVQPAAESEPNSPVFQGASVPTVDVRAASGETIRFKTQNGQTIDGVPAQTLELPHLVLYRNDALTNPDERTLTVEVAGIQAPPSGVTVTLEVTTQHEDPDAGSGETIPVWRDSQRITGTPDSSQTVVSAIFTHEFTETVIWGAEIVATPTDYFRYDIAVIDAQRTSPNPWHTFGKDYAFLMENQSLTPLPEVQEESDGAAPDELIVYYCDMVPFQKSDADISTRILREDVPDFVQAELVPQMVEAFRVETDVWGFPWYHAWTSYRLGEDAERLSVALTERQTWFHGWAAPNGHSGISLNVNGGDNAPYDTLADGMMSTFYHELFHNLQAGINQNSGGDGVVDGAEVAWQVFSEGTAVLASSVGQPAVHFVQPDGMRYHMFNANQFLASNLKSYEQMSPYYAGIYWRFLYEQCGGMKDGIEDPAAGMQVISHTLSALYSKDVVDISSSTDLIENLPSIMDHALTNASCPFQTYEDSLVHFARAIYGLRLDGGRCTGSGTPAGRGLHDPNSLYIDSPLSTITYTGAEQKYSGWIWSSFGMDFVDVTLDPSTDGQSLTIEFYGAPGADAEFSVEIYKLIGSGPDAKPQRIPAQMTAPETLTSANAEGHRFYTIPAIDTSHTNRLGLIITRTDAKQSSDWFGEFTLRLHPTGGSDGDSA